MIPLPLHEAASTSGTMDLTSWALLAAFIVGGTRLAFGPFIASRPGLACPTDRSHVWARGLPEELNYCHECGAEVEPFEVDGLAWRVRDDLLDRARIVRETIAEEVGS